MDDDEILTKLRTLKANFERSLGMYSRPEDRLDKIEKALVGLFDLLLTGVEDEQAT